MIRHYALGVAYDGAAFSGWQLQSDRSSVQGALEAALTAVAAHPVRISAAGRTDAGVHAACQVVGFSSPAAREDRAWVAGVNANLPATIRVRWVRPVPEHFHVRFTAVWRRYLYLLAEAEPPASSAPQVYCLGEGVRLDDVAMQHAARSLIGEQDFSTFRASGCQSASPYRLVHHARIHRWQRTLAIDVQANAFLLRMMRNITGALLEVGRGERSVEAFIDALKARDRSRIGRTAPPHGLHLVDVGYPDLWLTEPPPAALLPAPLGLGRPLAALV